MRKSSVECPDGKEGSFPNFSAWLQDHVILASLLILICSTAPRLFLTAIADPQDLLRPDSSSYFSPALSLLEQGAFLDSNKKPEIDRPPGYPVFLAAIMSMVGKDISGRDLHEILIVQTVILSWSVVILYWLARRILPPVMAFTGSLLAAFSPWGAVSYGLLLSEGLYVFVLAAVFLLMKLVEEASTVSGSVWRSAVVGLLTGAVILIRPLWPLVFLIAGGLVIQYGLKRKGLWIVLTVMMITATTPLVLWSARNAQEAQFNGISSIGIKTVWRCLAARVAGQIEGTGKTQQELLAEVMKDEKEWHLSVQEADQERRRRSLALFQEHPALTAYMFVLSAVEHLLHPMPQTIRTSGKLYLSGDYWVPHPLWVGYSLLWIVYLALASIGLRHAFGSGRRNSSIDRGWLLVFLGIGLLLTLASGVSNGAGSRMRISLELIIPLLAGVGLVSMLQSVPRIPVRS